MLDVLKFVLGSVAKKDFIPELQHFVIKDGVIRGFNGTLAICAPFKFAVDCAPRADLFVRAISNCGETEAIDLSMLENGKLSIKAGKFKANVECVAFEDLPHALPEGEPMAIDGPTLLAAFECLEPFIGNDASRPWSAGILLRGQSAFATCNVILVERWLGCPIPHAINLPKTLIREMLRIKEPPISAQVSETSITFHYNDGRWLRSQLYSTEWPDLEKVLNRPVVNPPKPLQQEVFDALTILKPFTDKAGRVYLKDGKISTHATDDEGAAIETPSITDEGIYNMHMLEILNGRVDGIDLSSWPLPCMFFGNNLRGAIIGQKD